jgi:hypothetical protein
VPYALFENDERLTRPFRTEQEVWEAAERADLIVLDGNGAKILDNDFKIKPCDATPDELLGAGDDIITFAERRSGDRPAGSNGPQSPSRTTRTTT